MQFKLRSDIKTTSQRASIATKPRRKRLDTTKIPYSQNQNVWSKIEPHRRRRRSLEHYPNPNPSCPSSTNLRSGQPLESQRRQRTTLASLFFIPVGGSISRKPYNRFTWIQNCTAHIHCTQSSYTNSMQGQPRHLVVYWQLRRR